MIPGQEDYFGQNKCDRTHPRREWPLRVLYTGKGRLLTFFQYSVVWRLPGMPRAAAGAAASMRLDQVRKRPTQSHREGVSCAVKLDSVR